MQKGQGNQKFWSRYARFYDMEVLRFSGKAYGEMYRLMARRLTKDMRVLEVATGTGLIAVNVASFVRSVDAVDFSPGMIAAAQKKNAAGNVRFSVEDATALSFEKNTFDAVIISNALHVMPQPEAALENIRRVLKPGGLLIAPNFSHGHFKKSTWNGTAFLLKVIGFAVESWQVLRAAFPLVYVEARGEAAPLNRG